jgi:hypothetical protein
VDIPPHAVVEKIHYSQLHLVVVRLTLNLRQLRTRRPALHRPASSFRPAPEQVGEQRQEQYQAEKRMRTVLAVERSHLAEDSPGEVVGLTWLSSGSCVSEKDGEDTRKSKGGNLLSWAFGSQCSQRRGTRLRCVFGRGFVWRDAIAVHPGIARLESFPLFRTRRGELEIAMKYRPVQRCRIFVESCPLDSLRQ